MHKAFNQIFIAKNKENIASPEGFPLITLFIYSKAACSWKTNTALRVQDRHEIEVRNEKIALGQILPILPCKSLLSYSHIAPFRKNYFFSQGMISSSKENQGENWVGLTARAHRHTAPPLPVWPWARASRMTTLFVHHQRQHRDDHRRGEGDERRTRWSRCPAIIHISFSLLVPFHCIEWQITEWHSEFSEKTEVCGPFIWEKYTQQPNYSMTKVFRVEDLGRLSNQYNHWATTFALRLIEYKDFLKIYSNWPLVFAHSAPQSLTAATALPRGEWNRAAGHHAWRDDRRTWVEYRYLSIFFGTVS